MYINLDDVPKKEYKNKCQSFSTSCCLLNYFTFMMYAVYFLYISINIAILERTIKVKQHIFTETMYNMRCHSSGGQKNSI